MFNGKEAAIQSFFEICMRGMYNWGTSILIFLLRIGFSLPGVRPVSVSVLRNANSGTH